MATLQRPRSRSGLPDAASTISKGGRPSTPSSNSSVLARPSTPRSASDGTPATPRSRRPSSAVVGSSKPDSASPSPSLPARPRLSFERSPRSADSKPKVAVHSDPLSRRLRGLESESAAAASQLELNAVKEDLKKAKEQILSLQTERERILSELIDVRRSADETNEKLQEALMAKRWAEEASEIEKFRADELEQAGIDEAQRREELWQKELDIAHGRHRADLDALVSTRHELENALRELDMALDAKNAALKHADDAMKIAELNDERARLLEDEVAGLKTNLEARAAAQASEIDEKVKKLEFENAALKADLQKAQIDQKQLIEMERLIEDLRIEAADAKRVGSDIGHALDECRKRGEFLETKLEEAELADKFKTESLALTMERLEESFAKLTAKDTEFSILEGKLNELELELAKQKAEIDDSGHRLDASQQEVFELQTTVDILKSKLTASQDVASELMKNVDTLTGALKRLDEVKSATSAELERCKLELEQERAERESLRVTLLEASREAKAAQERYLIKEADWERTLAEAGDLRLALKNTKENYEVMLDEVNYEIVCLRKTVERLEADAKGYSGEADSEVSALKQELEEVRSSLRGAENKLKAAGDDTAKVWDELRHLESVAAEAKEVAEAVSAENVQLRERLLDKENEVQSISQEYDELRVREADAVNKLAALLAEVTPKQVCENDDKPDSPWQPDCCLTKSLDADEVEMSKADVIVKLVNGFDDHVDEHDAVDTGHKEPLPMDGDIDDGTEKVSAEAPATRRKDSGSPEVSANGELGSNHMNGAAIDGMADSADVTGQQQQQKQQKKNQPLLKKFGNLLRKKNNQK